MCGVCPCENVKCPFLSTKTEAKKKSLRMARNPSYLEWGVDVRQTHAKIMENSWKNSPWFRLKIILVRNNSNEWHRKISYQYFNPIPRNHKCEHLAIFCLTFFNHSGENQSLLTSLSDPISLPPSPEVSRVWKLVCIFLIHILCFY